ncbi:MAG: hypothetical protein AAGC60_23040 [Acidobacteriota bacterium]
MPRTDRVPEAAPARATLDDAAFQRTFGRILAEPGLNERFIASPREVGRELGLDDAQIAALEATGLDKLRAFSHNLLSKRVGLLKKVCPAVYERAHQTKRLVPLASGFVRSHPPLESKEYSSRTTRDGFWFIDYLLSLDAEGSLDDPLLAEVARFERAMLSVSALEASLESSADFLESAARVDALERDALLAARPRRGPHTVIETFGRDIVEVIRSLGEGREPAETLEGPAPPGVERIVLFSKIAGWRNVRYAEINRQTRDLLELCDGMSTTREIAARQLRQSHSTKDFDAYADSCLGLLRKLTQINVITFDR